MRKVKPFWVDCSPRNHASWLLVVGCTDQKLGSVALMKILQCWLDCNSGHTGKWLDCSNEPLGFIGGVSFPSELWLCRSSKGDLAAIDY